MRGASHGCGAPEGGGAPARACWPGRRTPPRRCRSGAHQRCPPLAAPRRRRPREAAAARSGAACGDAARRPEGCTVPAPPAAPWRPRSRLHPPWSLHTAPGGPANAADVHCEDDSRASSASCALLPGFLKLSNITGADVRVGHVTGIRSREEKTKGCMAVATSYPLHPFDYIGPNILSFSPQNLSTLLRRTKH